MNFTAAKISPSFLEELSHALAMIKAYGSIEIFVQDRTVTQITVRDIKKTKVCLEKNGHGSE